MKSSIPSHSPRQVLGAEKMTSVGEKLCKDVHDMSMNGDEPPPEYVVKQSSFGSVDPSPPLGSFPLIDISVFSLLSTSPQQVEAELDKLRSALSNSAGCFQAIGHGIPSSFLDRVRRVAKQFFALPIEEKLKYSKGENGPEGYGSDKVVSDKQVLDWSHRLTLRVYPEDHRKLHLWPQTPNNFREILDEYAMKMRSMMEILYKAMARSLHLEESSFSKQFGERSLMQARFNFYPPCSRPDLVLGVKAHTDRSGITILLQDEEVEGLQILQDGSWVRVPVIPHALVVNLGDQMQIMSNGIFRSPMHRVVTNTKKMRMSLAVFHEPEPEREIGPVDGLVDEKMPRVYRNVKNYGNINYECYQKGIVALDTVKLS